MTTQDRVQNIGNWARSRNGLVTIVLFAIAGFFLIVEHYAHVFGFLPYALLLICPLMMLFMHGGHGGENGHQGHSNSNDKVKGHEGHSKGGQL